ncbi:GtrA family protein [Celerinatantimonas sp. YJH-8]|uniref:GtrA family protein n=1 Tax=Celerinatantimonas sp. YJH-8 TaxID=3228714 RepID=UPI0038C4F7A1
MLKGLLRYGLVGIMNTLVHWSIFLVIVIYISPNQSIANLIAFLIAVSGSFIINSKFTFDTQPNHKQYIYYVLGMGTLSLLVGRLSDTHHLYPLLTLVIYSGLSFLIGFLYSKFIVFKEAT